MDDVVARQITWDLMITADRTSQDEEKEMFKYLHAELLKEFGHYWNDA